jgi:hypothetical protein
VSAPEPGPSLRAIYARNDSARRAVAGLSGTVPALAVTWRQLGRALDDVPALAALIARLTDGLASARRDLASARLDRANLLAAMRATVAAHAEGEADPLSYVRDEISAAAERGDVR